MILCLIGVIVAVIEHDKIKGLAFIGFAVLLSIRDVLLSIDKKLKNK